MQVTNALALSTSAAGSGGWLESKLWGSATSLQVTGLESGGSVKVYQSNNVAMPELSNDPSAFLAATLSANGLTSFTLPVAAWIQFVKVAGVTPTLTTVRAVSQLIR